MEQHDRREGPHVVLINYGAQWEMIDVKVVGNFPSLEAAQRWISEHRSEAESVDAVQVVPMTLSDPSEGLTDWLHRPVEAP